MQPNSNNIMSNSLVINKFMSTENLTGNAGFDWESYEKGVNISGLSQEQLEQAYDGTLNKV